jgi:phenylalanyl-tRNA synthetase beta chain
MKISLDILRGYHAGLPAEPTAARHLLDDLGIEVKRAEGDQLTLELLANRGDHRCYLGLAREIAGRLGGAVDQPPSAPLVSPEELANHTRTAVEVELLTPACLVYVAVPLEIRSLQGALNPDAVALLQASGLRSVDPVVDATNIANFELGQPTHAFDADKVVGGIVVRLSRPGERAWPLFQAEDRELPEGVLVIADEEKVLAIAGVIGCEEAKVTAATRRVILESACFDPVLVHKASRKLGIHTDAAARFERGADPGMAEVGAGRVLWLLEEAGLARRTAPATVVWNWDDAPSIIPLERRRLEAWYGRSFPLPELLQSLGGLGFGVVGDGAILEVSVPSWRRWDVRTPEDLYEEVGRATGYNSLPAFLPPVGLGAILTLRERLRERLEAVLLGHGFYEVITDGFYGRDDRDKLGIQESHPLWAHVEMLNSLDKGFSLLKNSGLVQALSGLAENQALGVEQARVFEFTRCFHPDAQAANGYCREREILWLLVSGPERDADWAHRPASADFWLCKGILEELALEAGLSLALAPKGGHALSSSLHPHRQATIVVDGRQVGILGEVHPRLVKSWELRRHRPLYLELDLAELGQTPELPVAFPPLRPYSQRNLAFTLPLGVEAASVQAALRQGAPASLEQVAVVDIYLHEVEGAPVRTLTFELGYRNDEAALSTDEINQITAARIAAVEAELGSRGVRLRA